MIESLWKIVNLKFQMYAMYMNKRFHHFIFIENYQISIGQLIVFHTLKWLQSIKSHFVEGRHKLHKSWWCGSAFFSLSTFSLLVLFKITMSLQNNGNDLAKQICTKLEICFKIIVKEKICYWNLVKKMER